MIHTDKTASFDALKLQGARAARLLLGSAALVFSALFSIESVADHNSAYRQDFNKSHRATVNRRDKERGGSMLSMSEAISIAKHRHRGEVLAARRSINSAGETVYVIKILTKKGVVKTVRIPARR